MNAIPILVTAVLSAALLAGCNPAPEQSDAVPAGQVPAPAAPIALPTPQGAQTPPTAAERKEGAEPVQGQVDTKEPAQRRGFEAPKG